MFPENENPELADLENESSLNNPLDKEEIPTPKEEESSESSVTTEEIVETTNSEEKGTEEVEAEVEVEAKVEEETEPEGKAEVEVEAKVEEETEPEGKAEVEVEAKVEEETEPEGKAEVEVEAKVEEETEPEGKAEVEVEAKVEEETEPEGKDEVEVEAKVEKETEPEGKDEEDAEAESSLEVAHIVIEEEEVELPPLNEELLPQIDALLKERGNLNTLDNATVGDLILLLRKYQNSPNVLPNIPKVGLVKRTFDTLMGSDQEFPQPQINLFNRELGNFNRIRTEAQQRADEAKAVNSKKKQELLAELEKLVGKEDPMLFREVRSIQNEWRDIGHVLKEDIEPLYKQYRFLLDKFYKLREMHFELLDYDRKINLQEKEKLIKEAEGLIPPEEDRENIDVWRERMDMLHELQQKWKSIGHVPREDLDRINNSYREVVDRFFDVRHGFIEIQDQLRQENADKKNVILEQMTPYATFQAEKPREWNEATKVLRGLQEQWKQIGQAPQKVNGELWSKYRDACNAFFTRKSDFFKKYDEFRGENLIKKRELVEQAEALQNSTDWEKTSRELKRLQKDWKQIGPVPERHSNKLWNRFREACDKFFEFRRAHYQDLHQDENENYQAKKALIEEVKKLKADSEGGPEKAIHKIKEIQASWKEIGKVPYKEKDRIWEEFRGEVDKFFGGLDMKREQIQDIRMKASFDSVDNPDARSKAIKFRISKLRRKLQTSQEKVDQYSINIQFISKGKSGDSLRKQIQDEIDKEIKFIDEWKRKIKNLNEMLKNPPSPDDKLQDDDDDENTNKVEVKEKAEVEAKAKVEAKEKEETEPEVEVEAKAEKETEPEAKVKVEAKVKEETEPEAKVEAKVEVETEPEGKTEVEVKEEVEEAETEKEIEDVEKE